ncbi:Aminotransferase, class IV [Kalmanozyma brasiliensis GHG001]|uniref:MINDY deubiquitinase domain-containing protein n=1 Tax=Kalmanozyma brasiliensis (strain GHG001) TaxID=1365824 RepID=V5GLK1_KALBG|nr:Aminotransferase, class IV [Kalmanozyma brasiliensis GHG001]EST06847.1 Aminotransferase, class IV [Kalmanozyma brasiliensis GHG001]
MNGGGSAAAGAGAADAGAAAFQSASYHSGHTNGANGAATTASSGPQNYTAMATAASSQPPPSTSIPSGAGAEEAQWSLKDIFWRGRECKIITQNQNGPCSLIALCNILLLRGELQITPPDRPVVSYSYLSQLLAEHLLTKVGTEGFGGEGLEAALSTLPRTQYGLDVDVGFNSITSFAATAANDGGAGELALFRLCGVPLVHGWLPDPADAPTFQAVQAAGSYNKATDILVRGDEIAEGAVVRDRGVGLLAAKLASESSASNGKQPERQAWSDEQRTTVRQALALQSFLETQSTQLTYHGLFVLAQEIPAGQPVALFRNSHLSVLYKRLPNEGTDVAADGATQPPPTLFTLATDASFLMEDEIVWESLVDVDGASSEFYDGKFHKSTMRQGDYVGRDADGLGGPGGGAGLQQNEDADYALAMQIYHNDQDRLERQQRRRDRRSQQVSQQGLAQGQRSSMAPAPQPAFEAPNEVFTTMRYEVNAKQEEGDALVVSTLIPARLRIDHAGLLNGLQNLSLGEAGASQTVPTSQSTNPFLNATESAAIAPPASHPTNPFLTSAAPPIKHRLYHHVPLLDQHLERLKTSAGAMCRAYSAVWSMPLLEQERSLQPERILEAIEASLASSEVGNATQGQVKGIRVAISRDGGIRVTQRNITPFPSTLDDGLSTTRPPSVRLDFMPTRVRTMDLEPIVFNKTDARGFYEAAKQRVGADPSVLSGVRETDDRCFDVILWNDEQTEMLEEASSVTAPTRLVTESSLANVLVEQVSPAGVQSRFVTPRTSTGMLDGLLRRWLVNKGLVEEADVELDELVRQVREGSAHIWLCNSLRGVWRVDLADPPRIGAAGINANATGSSASRVKKTRFSSFVRGASYKNAHNGAATTAAPSGSAVAPPPAAPYQPETVHNQVQDDLYGHKQDGSNSSGKGLNKLKGKKTKAGKDDKKDCLVM